MWPVRLSVRVLFFPGTHLFLPSGPLSLRKGDEDGSDVRVRHVLWGCVSTTQDLEPPSSIVPVRLQRFLAKELNAGAVEHCNHRLDRQPSRLKPRMRS